MAGAWAWGGEPSPVTHEPEATSSSSPLRALSAAKGVAFGAGIGIRRIETDPAFTRAVTRDCSIVVATNDMKMEVVEASPDRLDFAGADATARFARDHAMRLRGTTLVWYRGMPDWFVPTIRFANAERLMRAWIATVAGRYRGAVDSWDVVNEAIEPQKSGDPGAAAFRRTPWFKALGPAYIPLAFHLLAETDPNAAGLWNEDDMEPDAGWVEARRSAFLCSLENLVRADVPIRRVGLQSHLNSTLPFDDGRFRAFLKRIADLGLAIEITELDVDDRAFPADPALRDDAVGAFVKRYLDVVLDEPAVLNVLTWDYADGDSWYDHGPRRRPDGLPNRGLPFSAEMRPKPMRRAIAAAFAGAPDHRATRDRLRMAGRPVPTPL